MKKFLLTLAAISIATGAWAQTTAEPIPEGYIDVTPTYFKFYQNEVIPLDELLRDDIKSGLQANLGSNSLITENTNKGENYFTADNLSKGNLVYRAGGYFTDAQPCPLKKAFSTYNFGGDIKNVLIINGKDSELDQAIKEFYNLPEKPVISKMGADFANFQLMWIADYFSMNEKIPTETNVRVRMEFNIYNNDMSSTDPVLTQFLFQQEQGGTQSNVLTPTAKISDFALNGKWNPNKWMVLDFECPYNRLASYVRTHVNFGTSGAMKSAGAYLIRSIEIYGLPGKDYSSDLELNKLYNSWNDYTPQPSYDEIDSITLSHPQSDSFELSGTENAELSFTLAPAEGNFDPTTKFELAVSNNDNEYVTFSEIKDGKFTVSVKETAAASEEPVEISVKAGDKTSNVVALNHYAAPADVTLSTHESLTDKEISLKTGDNAVEFAVTVVSKHESQTGAYQKFRLSSVANDCATIEMNATSTGIVVTPKAIGTTTFTLTPLKAGEANLNADPTAQGTTYSISVGTTGVESIEVVSGDAEYFNLQGVKVANPERGIYIKKQGDTTTKVLVK